MLKFGTNRVLIIIKLDTFDTFFHFNGDFLLTVYVAEMSTI